MGREDGVDRLEPREEVPILLQEKGKVLTNYLFDEFNYLFGRSSSSL